MKYNIQKFNEAVGYYSSKLKGIKGKNILLLFDVNNKNAFLSIAPLSRAAHEQRKDVCCISKPSKCADVLLDVWELYTKFKAGVESEKTKALELFIKEGKKQIKDFERLFKKPDIILHSKSKEFSDGFRYKTEWFKDYRKRDLLETAKILWKQLVNIKKKESIGMGFELIPGKKDLELPLEDYLDSYAILWAMKEAVKGAYVAIGASTSRKSMIEASEKISELKTTLIGCELDKEVDEPIFKKFKKLSSMLKLNRLKPNQATFYIHGKGYPGTHTFGEKIGYPSLNKKTRWQAPGGIIYKLEHYPQTRLEPRDPMGRVAFTETLPIDIFIKSNKINWFEMEKRNQKIIKICNKCEVIFVEGDKIKEQQTKLEIGLRMKNGDRRRVKSSGTDVRSIINKDYYKDTGIKAGTMANIPGGEAFMTPEYVKGAFIGDVVISLDQSYMLNKKEPLYIKCDGNSYKIISGPKNIIKKFSEKKRDSWKKILEQEKNKKIPRELIRTKKANFNNIGEFAINTNPNAELCNYLIVNEKIANMIHIALGSGFEPDRATEYHTDIVIDAPRQRMNIYGVDSKGKEHWILNKGKFAV